jgi:hypothetical protein
MTQGRGDVKAVRPRRWGAEQAGVSQDTGGD